MKRAVNRAVAQRKRRLTKRVQIPAELVPAQDAAQNHFFTFHGILLEYSVWIRCTFQNFPEFSWTGKILTEKELRGHYRDWVYGDRKVLRKKYKDNNHS